MAKDRFRVTTPSESAFSLQWQEICEENAGSLATFTSRRMKQLSNGRGYIE
jgi:hypothetical protein